MLWVINKNEHLHLTHHLELVDNYDVNRLTNQLSRLPEHKAQVVPTHLSRMSKQSPFYMSISYLSFSYLHCRKEAGARNGLPAVGLKLSTLVQRLQVK